MELGGSLLTSLKETIFADILTRYLVVFRAKFVGVEP